MELRWWVLGAVLLSGAAGLRCHGGERGEVDECREGRGFRGRLTKLMYHPEKRLESRLVCARSLVKDGRGGWEPRLGCAKRTLSPPDFHQDGGQCFYNTDQLYYDWYVTCVCDGEMCNGPQWAQEAMVPEKRFLPDEQGATSAEVSQASAETAAPEPSPAPEDPPTQAPDDDDDYYTMDEEGLTKAPQAQPLEEDFEEAPVEEEGEDFDSPPTTVSPEEETEKLEDYDYEGDEEVTTAGASRSFSAALLPASLLSALTLLLRRP